MEGNTQNVGWWSGSHRFIKSPVSASSPICMPVTHEPCVIDGGRAKTVCTNSGGESMRIRGHSRTRIHTWTFQATEPIRGHYTQKPDMMHSQWHWNKYKGDSAEGLVRAGQKSANTEHVQMWGGWIKWIRPKMQTKVINLRGRSAYVARGQPLCHRSCLIDVYCRKIHMLQIRSDVNDESTAEPVWPYCRSQLF